MNTISNSQSTIDATYALKKIQEAKDLAEYKVEQKQKQEDSDSIKISEEALQTVGSSIQGASNNSSLASLVSAGTLTQDQANAVESIFQSGSTSIQASGTYNNTNKSQSPLAGLVASGTITEDQENEIKSVFQAEMKANKLSDSESTSTQTDPLDSLVTSGTITQAQ